MYYLLDDLIEKLQKQMEDLKLDNTRKIKQVERISEEKDRKLRKAELEGNKMREKLRHLTNKDRSNSNKNAATLKSYQRGAEVVTAPSSPSPSGVKSKGKRSPGGDESVVSVEDVLAAMEEEQGRLHTQNAELEKQVSSLTKRLKKVMNDNSSSPTKQDNIVFNFNSTSSTVSSNNDNKNKNKNKNKDDIITDDVHVLSDKVQEQSQRIRQLVHQLEGEAANVKKQSADGKILRQRAGEMREEIHNLRLEIDSRPTMAQWNAKVSLNTSLFCFQRLTSD
jgi:hypothetical protein